MKAPRQPLYLLDASVYIFRAYFALPESIRDTAGNTANALYGYANALCKLLRDEKPQYVVAAFDASLTTSFRNEFYPLYKANRELPPPELERQLSACFELTQCLGIKCIKSSTYEADDIIGTVAKLFRTRHTAIFVTTDKDLAQLMEDGDTFWDIAKDERFSCAAMEERFGVPSARMADYLALVGDKVDNIPGVPGVGKKTAALLIQRYEDLKSIYRNLEAIAQSELRGAKNLVAKLEANRAQAELSLKLAQIYRDVPLKLEAADLQWQPPASATIEQFAEAFHLGDGLRKRLRQLSV